MAIELHLPNGAPAHYEWLSTVIYIDDTSPLELLRLVELNTDPTEESVLANFSELKGFVKDLGTLSAPKPWKSLQEAIADLSSRHEFCHYVQDIATGVGHWDELTFRSEFAGLASMYSNKQDWTGLKDFRSKLVDEKLEGFLVLVPPRIEERRKRERVSFLERAGIATLSPGGDVRSFGMANLLEADAVAEVAIHASDMLRQGDPTVDRLLFDDAAAHLWNPFDMPTGYRILFDDWKAVVMTDVADVARSFGETREGTIALLSFLVTSLQQLTDIALAYPAPSYFNGVPEDRRMYFDPVVKFYCLLSAFHQMSAKAGQKMTEWMDGNVSDFQEALLTDSQFRDIFPDRAEIYKGWEQDLNKRDEDDVILRVRKHGAKVRQGEKVIVRRSPLGSDLVAAGGLWWWNSRRLPWPVFSGDMETFSDLRGTQDDILCRISDVRILELLCNRKVISCPLAGKNCPGERQFCNDGFGDPRAFPTEQCMLRHRYGSLCHYSVFASRGPIAAMVEVVGAFALRH
jgi:hypothetical protein